MKKLLSAIIMLAVVMAVNAAPLSANSLTFHHGNNNTSKKCYAQTEQTASDSIGALITWQLTNDNTVYYGSTVNSTGATATSYSKKLKGKSGKSYGYYYHNGNQVWKSTAWYSFSF